MKKILIRLLVLATFLFLSKQTYALTNSTDRLSSSLPSQPAMHTISFTTTQAIPTNGRIVVSFPPLANGDVNNAASASASTFELNNLQPSQIKVSEENIDFTTAVTFSLTNSTGSGSSPTITMNNTGQAIPANTIISLFLGCNLTNGISCTNQAPTILNPGKTNSAGISDIWKVTVITYDDTNTRLESANIQIATTDPVNVQATILPFLSFIIAGLPDGTAITSPQYCGALHEPLVTNAGLQTNSTNVDLGTLLSKQPHYAAQTLTLFSNGLHGYAIVATGSGNMRGVASGYMIPNAQGNPTTANTPSPQPITANAEAFGIHACDAHSKVNSLFWGTSPIKFANPSQFYYTIASSNFAPASSGDTMIVVYGMNVVDKTPGGQYQTTLTYIATPLF